MIYANLEKKNFNIPQNTFNNSKKLSFSKVGTFVIDGYIGPDGGNAISDNKILSMKKAFSEMIERRSLMIGGYINNNSVETWELIRQEKSCLPHEFTIYKTTQPHPCDTTGTSVHAKTEIAILKGLLELLEKNGLFLFWYGKWGKEYILPKRHKIRLLANKRNTNVRIFVNEYFAPLYIVIIIFNDNYFIYGSGIGISANFNEALENAFDEANLIKSQEDINYVTKLLYNKQHLSERYNFRYHSECIDYLNSFNLKLFNESELQSCPSLNLNLYEVISFLPSWISNLHVIALRQFINKRLKCVRIFSTDLYNHLPLKELINLETTINQILNLTINDLKEIPNCIVK